MLRTLLYLSCFVFFFSCQQKKEAAVKLIEPVAPLYDSSLKPFYHGLASGDPLTDRVVIWTRVTPDDSLRQVSVRWEVSESETFDELVKSDSTVTGPQNDYTVKVDVTGLSPGRFYYYRFQSLGKKSQVGRTKTLPAEKVDSVKFAVVSCSNWEFGYFNAYFGIAKKDLDAVIHLGDYIYEYGPGTYGNKDIDRKHLPPYEIVSLQDYRTRYSQYHLDKGLQAARARHPFITIWDDHEVANDVYATGAKNHQPDKEGDFAARKAAARKAYYEWMPIRENEKLYRSFIFGNLTSLIMLDERLEARVKQLDSLSDPALFNDRTMLGKDQLAWFETQLRNPNTTWKLIGNQVLFSDLDQSAKKFGHQRNLDSWDGYPVEKKRIEDFIVENKIGDVVFLAGDTHSSWAFEVATDPARYNPKSSKGAIAVEFGVTSISSGNSNESAPDDTVKLKEADLLRINPHLKFTNHRDHGYLVVALFPEKARAQYYFVETLARMDDREKLERIFTVRRGTHQLK